MRGCGHNSYSYYGPEVTEKEHNGERGDCAIAYPIYIHEKGLLEEATTEVCSYWLLPSTREVPGSISGPRGHGGRTASASFHTFPTTTPDRLGLTYLYGLEILFTA